MATISAERHRRFERRIRLVVAAGIELPSEFIALQTRLKSLHSTLGSSPCRDRLVTALVQDDRKADLPLLWAASLAEAAGDNQQRKAVDDAVRDGVNDKLRALYAAHANAFYDQLAAQFDESASAFMASVGAVDPELPADAIVAGTEEQRSAWLNAQIHAQALTRLLEPLRAAATLCGIHDDSDPDSGLGLVVDPAGKDREAVWKCWDTEELERQAADVAAAGGPISRPAVTPSRCGRWGALVRLGCTIRAVELDQFHEYPRRAEPEFAPNTVTSLGRVPEHLLNSAAP